MSPFEAYIAVCLVTSGTWAYVGQKWSRKTLSLVVFFPGLFTVWFLEEASFPSRVVGFGQFNLNLQFSVLGGFLAMGAISLSLLVNWITGWGKIDEREKYEDPTSSLVPMFLCSMAEEVGWRCYLLPLLVQRYGMMNGIFISAIITGLYHVPEISVMALRYKHPRPFLSVFLVYCHRFLMSYPISWLSIKTGYRMWGPVMMLFTWNRINPVTTGNFYTNEQAKVRGPLWLVNAQGVSGCLALLPIIIFVVYQVQFNM